MIKKLSIAILALTALGFAGFWILTLPNGLKPEQVAALPTGDAVAGETIFWAGGCASCHAAKGATGDSKLVLSGGVELKTPFGTFHAPNISSDEQHGIGKWSLEQFINAMKRGVSPQGEHYYPAFPYTSYARMTDKDVADLFAYLKTLPDDQTASKAHELGFPFNIRRGLGLWKRLYLSPEPVLSVEAGNAQLERGRYLVEGPAHCGACHTPRNLIGGPKLKNWLAGGPAAEGSGSVPNLTPHASGLGNWSTAEIADSLKTGFTPEFDSFGSSMADVQENMAKLTDEDRAAIAAYLKAVPAMESSASK